MRKKNTTPVVRLTAAQALKLSKLGSVRLLRYHAARGNIPGAELCQDERGSYWTFDPVQLAAWKPEKAGRPVKAKT